IRDAHHLVIVRQAPKLFAHSRTASSSHACINLIEHEGRGEVGGGKDGLEREHQTRGLTTGGYLGQRLQWLTGVEGDEELYLIYPLLCKGPAPLFARHGRSIVRRRL